MKHPREWDEDYTISLPGEDDTLERKGTRLLDLTISGVDENEVRNELAKQLSAFANTGGGRIVYGLTNEGKVDKGGVSTRIKGKQSTKEWLEDIIPSLTEHEIIGVNVYEIPPKEKDSQIDSRKALYVVDIPDSDRAPHQSLRDYVYYVRLGGKSRPARHRMIEDIRNRSKHPDVRLQWMEITEVSAHPAPPGVMLINFTLRIGLKNRGPLKAGEISLELTSEPQTIAFVGYDGGVASRRQGTDINTWVYDFKETLYPDMETPFRILCSIQLLRAAYIPGKLISWAAPQRHIKDADEEIAIVWKLFADSAPPKTGRKTLGELSFSTKTLEALRG